MRHGMILATVLLALGLGGCATTVDLGFIMDSVDAVQPVVDDYAAKGCRQVTIAPALTVDWEGEGRTTFGGGVFVGCEAEGRMVEFRCQQAVTPGEKAWCEQLRLWVLKMQPETPAPVPAPVTE